MTKDFIDFLKLYSYGIVDRECEQFEFDIDSVCKIARNQDASGIIYYAINRLYGNKFENNETYKACNRIFLMEYVSSVKKRNALLLVLKKLNEKGIKYRVLKGVCLGSLYPEPAIRKSVDVDILADREFISPIVDELKGMGFVAEQERDDTHHICCFNPVAGSFEVHHMLYDECFDEAWFESKFSPIEDTLFVDIDGVSVPTLGVTDGLIFDFLHLIKHFLLTGTTVQQISDILLYIKKYKDQICWERANKLFAELRYDIFFYGLLTIGRRYMNFNESDLPDFVENVNSANCILYDLETGGAYGHLQRKERDKFYHRYTKDRFDAEKKGISYEKYIAEKKHITIIDKIFSRKSKLEQKYIFLKKHSWLLPVAWILRWIDGAKRIAVGKVKVKEYARIMPNSDNEVINERMKIVNELNML